MSKQDMALQYFRDNPSATTRECARECGISKRTARRARAQYRRESGLAPVEVPKVLILDIETSPMEVLVWGLYKQRIPDDNVLKDWCILSWSAKWLCDTKIMGQRLSGREAKARNDKRILRELWELLDESHVIIAHNGERFDLRKINARFFYWGFSPPNSYHIVDTLKIARSNFALSSNRLDFILKSLNRHAKIKTDYSLWKRAVDGDDSAIEEMFEYNKNDVVILEDLYMLLRPWVKGHPNMSLFVESDDPVCPNCGHIDLAWAGFYYTLVGKYRAFRCGNCGAIGRTRFTEVAPSKRKNMLTSTVR